MTDIRRMLDGDERAEYDRLFYDALKRPDGSRRKANEIGPEMHRLLIDARKAGRKWASWVLDDAVIAGLGSMAKRWAATKEVIETVIGERVVTKPAAYGIRRKQSGGGAEQLRLGWADMTEEDLDQLVASRSSQVAAENDTIAFALKCKALIRRTGKSPLSEALAAIGITFDEFLAEAA